MSSPAPPPARPPPPPLPSGHRASGTVLRTELPVGQPVRIDRFHLTTPDGRTHGVAGPRRVDVAMGDGLLAAVLRPRGGELWLEFDFAGLSRVPFAHRNALLALARKSGQVRLRETRPGVRFAVPSSVLGERRAWLAD